MYVWTRKSRQIVEVRLGGGLRCLISLTGTEYQTVVCELCVVWTGTNELLSNVWWRTLRTFGRVPSASSLHSSNRLRQSIWNVSARNELRSATHVISVCYHGLLDCGHAFLRLKHIVCHCEFFRTNVLLFFLVYWYTVSDLSFCICFSLIFWFLLLEREKCSSSWALFVHFYLK